MLSSREFVPPTGVGSQAWEKELCPLPAPRCPLAAREMQPKPQASWDLGFVNRGQGCLGVFAYHIYVAELGKFKPAGGFGLEVCV